MELLTPGTGLFIWQAIIFLALILLLKKLAWTPIIESLKIRESSIQDALDSAEKAREEMAKLSADNEKLLQQARIERDELLKDAVAVGNKLKEEAKEEASKMGARMIEDARLTIQTEKKAALAEVKSLVSSFSIEIAEKLLRKNLSDDKSQKALVEDFIKDVNIN